LSAPAEIRGNIRAILEEKALFLEASTVLLEAGAFLLEAHAPFLEEQAPIPEAQAALLDTRAAFLDAREAFTEARALCIDARAGGMPPVADPAQSEPCTAVGGPRPRPALRTAPATTPRGPLVSHPVQFALYEDRRFVKRFRRRSAVPFVYPSIGGVRLAQSGCSEALGCGCPIVGRGSASAN
jgi:hypothetical protein